MGGARFLRACGSCPACFAWVLACECDWVARALLVLRLDGGVGGWWRCVRRVWVSFACQSALFEREIR